MISSFTRYDEIIQKNIMNIERKKKILLMIKIAIGITIFAASLQFYINYDFYMNIESSDLIVYLGIPIFIYLLLFLGLIISYFIFMKK